MNVLDILIKIEISSPLLQKAWHPSYKKQVYNSYLHLIYEVFVERQTAHHNLSIR